MKTFIMLGWRNLWRQKRRSLVVVFSITLAALMVLLAIGIMNGMIAQMLDNSLSTKLGHIAITGKGFSDTMRIENNFYPSEKILSAVRKDSDVTAFAPRVKVYGMIRSGESSRGVMVIGVSPATENNVSKINEYTLPDEGGTFLSDPDALEILISKSLADKLDVAVGDRIVLMLNDKDNEMAGVGLTVKGFFQTPIEEYDNMVVYMGINRLQTITNLGGNISELTIITKKKEIADAVKLRLARSINDPALDILSWKDMAPFLVKAIKLIDMILLIYYAIFFITVVFSIANTLIMSIMERFHEIGVMKSIGTRPSQVFFIVMFEALNLGAVGLVAGLTTGFFLLLALSFTGIDLSVFMDAMRQWGAGSVIYPFMTFKDVIITTVVVELTTIIAAIYPAVKAARIKPLDALHYV